MIKLRNIKNILPFLFSIIGTIIGISLNFILARVLGSEKYGDIQYLLSLATLFSSFFVFGLSWFVIRESKNPLHRGRVMNKIFTLFFFLSFYLVPIFVYVLKNYINLSDELFIPIIIAVAFVMAINALGSANFQGTGNYHKSLVFENILPKFLMLISVIVFLAFGVINSFPNYYLILYLLFYGSFSLFIVKKMFKKISLDFSKKELASISFFFGVTITYSLTSNLTKILQANLYGNNSVVGIISVSLTLLSFVSLFGGVLTNMTKPIFARLTRENKITELIDTYRFSTRAASYIAIPLYVFFITQGDKFLILFGESYTQVPIILILLTLNSMFTELTGPTGTMLSMTGHEKLEIVNGIINLLTFAVSAFAFSFSQEYGYVLALLTSSIVVNICKYLEVWVIYKIPPLNLKSLLKMLLVAVVNFFVIYPLSLISNYLIWFIASLVAGIVLVVINFTILPIYKFEIKKLMELKV